MREQNLHRSKQSNRVKDETDHPFNNPANWKEVSNLTVEELVVRQDESFQVLIKSQFPCQVRIRMKTCQKENVASISDSGICQ